MLPAPLAEVAEFHILRGEKQDRARAVLLRWAEMESNGHLIKKKETVLNALFLHEVFGEGLGYSVSTQSPERYHLERNFAVPGVGTADGAIGIFGHNSPAAPVAVIELKGANTDLDADRFDGRTSVQRCWDYLNALPDCPWGIVSNFVTIRLYHRDKMLLAYEEFSLQELRDVSTFRQFFYLFERDGLLTSSTSQSPRAMQLLKSSDDQRLAVGDKLYRMYSDHRFQLIRHLKTKHGKTRDAAIRIAQKLLDRIIFIAFCEQRGLLPDKCLEQAYLTLPPWSKVTNPRWRNFLDLFHAIDKGHERLERKTGYHGGLFRHDPEVDDLQLADDWTLSFREIAGYDFRDEVNVEVLGHIFEKSIGDLQRLRTVSFFDGEPVEGGRSAAPSAMRKSAERKRSGTYYTPPDFTRFLVHETVAKLIQTRHEAIRIAQGLTLDDLALDSATPALTAYWRACWVDLTTIKVCDPACGSGAFLIQAYETFEDAYVRVADHRRAHEGAGAELLVGMIPDLILTENLHGVDLSEQAVEISQLALWIRSARRGKTLADLSENIVWGNSLVDDPAGHPKAMNWEATFPHVFNRVERGFDCVIGNPPWERLKLQEREFFSESAPEIAAAVSAADRRGLIAKLEAENPELNALYVGAKSEADRMLDFARESGKYPLTGQGDINTYMLFAELARKIVAPHGRVGLLLPSGIATDHTNKEYFAQVAASKQLIALYDFENKLPVFPDVHRSFKFCTLIFGGAETGLTDADFVFFARRMEDLRDKKRHIVLSAKDLVLLNPNTRTCPIFRTRRDAELTKAIYRRVPILVDETRQAGGNPWGVKFVRMFDQTNDADLFKEPSQFAKEGMRLVGNRWVGKKKTFLPLYEAKMIQAYDHRAASVRIVEGNWVRQGQTEPTSLVEHQNPEFVVQPRWWVEEGEVLKGVKGNEVTSFIGFKDITSPTNARTMIAAAIPWSAVTNHFPIMLTQVGPRLQTCLLANLNSIIFDYVTRQKIGGITLNFFIVNQLPILAPDEYEKRCAWDCGRTLQQWISERVLKLTCTAEDLKPFAEAAGFDLLVYKWEPGEREELKAELDAAYFHLYGLKRAEVEYVLGTFRGMKVDDQTTLALASGPELILQAFDKLTEASRSRG